MKRQEVYNCSRCGAKNAGFGFKYPFLDNMEQVHLCGVCNRRLNKAIEIGQDAKALLKRYVNIVKKEGLLL